jgi:hypothetical protein
MAARFPRGIYTFAPIISSAIRLHDIRFHHGTS